MQYHEPLLCLRKVALLAHAHVMLSIFSLLWNCYQTFLFNTTWLKLLLRTTELSFNFIQLVVTISNLRSSSMVQTNALHHHLHNQRTQGIIVLNPFGKILPIMIDSWELNIAPKCWNLNHNIDSNKLTSSLDLTFELQEWSLMSLNFFFPFNISGCPY